MPELSAMQVAQWAAEHNKCPEGLCDVTAWEGWEAAYSCRHCMARRQQIENLNRPNAFVPVALCDHGESVREAMNQIDVMARRMAISTDVLIKIAGLVGWPAVLRAYDSQLVQDFIAMQRSGLPV